jgi:hypothetical protein
MGKDVTFGLIPAGCRWPLGLVKGDRIAIMI